MNAPFFILESGEWESRRKCSCAAVTCSYTGVPGVQLQKDSQSGKSCARARNNGDTAACYGILDQQKPHICCTVPTPVLEKSLCLALSGTVKLYSLPARWGKTPVSSVVPARCPRGSTSPEDSMAPSDGRRKSKQVKTVRSWRPSWGEESWESYSQPITRFPTRRRWGGGPAGEKRRLWEGVRNVERWAGLICVVGTCSPSSLGSWSISGARTWERQASSSQLAGCDWEKCSVLPRLPRTSSGQSAQCQNWCGGRNKKTLPKPPGEEEKRTLSSCWGC